MTQSKYFATFLARLDETKEKITTTATPSELKKYEPKPEGEKKFADKHTVKKIADANKNADDVFTGSNIKMIDRPSTRHGYNPGADEAAYEELDLDQIFSAENINESSKEAKDHYKELHSSVLSRLDAIKDAVKSHRDNAKDYMHWGHVGDLNHVHDRLREIHQFVGQSIPEKPKAIK